MSSKLIVTNETTARLNHNIFGNFMEFLENHISGMWAEKLWNRKFEDITENKALPERWRADSIKNRSLHMVSDEPHMGNCCIKMTCLEDSHGDTALAQDMIAAEKGKKYIGSIWLRGKELSSGIRIAVGRNYGRFFISYGEAFIENIGENWKKHSFEFISDSTDADAEFTIRFAGTGSLWVDAVSLMPADNVMGWRADVIEHIKKLKPGIIRFPGGCYADIYHWKQAIGDRDSRMPQDNFAWSDVPWDYKESHKRTGRHKRLTEINDVGIDDFMNLCEITGTQPLICVNLGSGTAKEAADWVEYCNGAATTKYGALRAENGHEAPYSIKIWQIGNEMYGGWEVGYSGLEGYIKGFLSFHETMSKADPSIEFMADGCGDPNWNKELYRQIGKKMKYLDVHYYPGFDANYGKGTPEDVFEGIYSTLQSVTDNIKSLREELKECGLEGHIKIGVCEWTCSGGNWGPDRIYMATLGNALFSAFLLDQYMKNADLIEMANYSNLTNAWWSSAIRTNHSQSHVSATYHVLSMLSRATGGNMLKTTLESDLPECAGAPFVEANASVGDGFVTIAFINRSADAQVVNLDLSAHFAKDALAEYTFLSGKSLEMFNDFAIPDRVAPVESKVTVNPSGEFIVPKYSFSTLKIKIN
jgi:alpha-N-arabinofuranosidase